MQFLIHALIISGSVLMAYNIIRYGMFLKRNSKLDRQSVNRGLTIVPLVLLVFFLAGYLGVAFSGIANLLIALILFGGSVFVFLLLFVMFSIIGHIRDTEEFLPAQYDKINAEINAMNQDSLSMLRVNLTKDLVEDRSGEFLYDTDYQFDKYSELIEARSVHVLDAGLDGSDPTLFRPEGLLKHFQEGLSTASR